MTHQTPKQLEPMRIPVVVDSETHDPLVPWMLQFLETYLVFFHME
jgi:hypothetical protein